MNYTVPDFVSYILAWSGSIAAVWFLFEKAGDTLKIEIKESISNWLKNVEIPIIVEKWPSQFAKLFDTVFGKKHLTFRCFIMSCFASTFFSFIMFLVWKTYQGEAYHFLANKDNFISSAIGAFILVFFLNWIPDYISLLESRYIIRFMSKTSKSSLIVTYLLVDLLLTLVIWVLFLIVFFRFGSSTSIFQKLTLPVNSVPQVLKYAALFISKDYYGISVAGVFFYTTFFTSIWVWLYVISGLLVKLLIRINPLFNFLKKVLEFEKKPLRSMGLVSIGLVTLFFIILPIQ